MQFCANDPETFRRAVEHTVRMMGPDNLPDAIDLNLGCPQVIARRGHFGSFLQEDWELVRNGLHVFGILSRFSLRSIQNCYLLSFNMKQSFHYEFNISRLFLLRSAS